MDGLRQARRPGGKPPTKRRFEFKLKFNLWTVVIGFLLVIFFLPLFLSFAEMRGESNKIEISQALSDIKQEKVEKVEVQNERVLLTYKDESVKISIKEENENFSELLEKAGVQPTDVNYTVVDQSLTKVIGEILSIVLPLGLMAVFFFFIIRSQSRGAQDIFSFGRSRAKLFAKGKQAVTFKDVAGVEDAKKELEEVVDFLKNPAKYRRIGARTPKGAILFGPAGVGKTLLARAVAGEAGVPFFSMAGSEFMEMLVGVGASVTGDTPVLVKEEGKIRLLPIKKFVDKFYRGNGSEGLVKAKNVETLGLKPETNGFWGSRSNKRPVFGGSKWQPVQAVYRHRVNEIYEIGYLGGRLRTTGDHSVFVREHGGIRAKEVRKLKPGDVLVNLPMNTREWDYKERKTLHHIKKHTFPKKVKPVYLDFWNENRSLRGKYEYALAKRGERYQYEIASEMEVSQMTISNWQRGVHSPQLLSRKLVKMDLPDRVFVTKNLMKLFGYYTAEGRGTNSLEFTFGMHERKFIEEVAKLMAEVFGVRSPKLKTTNSNTIKVIYYSAHLGRFFAKYCGNGSHNKHVPPFIWDLPKEYFLAYLKGYSNGDGYITKSGKLSVTSVSQRLIRELSWLCGMHGKPLPETESWTLIVGKTSNPFIRKGKHPHQFKRCIVRSVKRKPFSSYVYDLCGVENEAFFGGEKPILLHNSRVRDLFAQAKTSAPSIIFIDEIDAIGRQRGRGFVGGHDEREQTLNQILVEMDGFTPNDKVVVVAATNRGDLLDPALLRPGRFDRRVMLDMPDKEGRDGILKIHARGKKFVKGINWGRVADRTVGFSGADLENMLNEAAILAARQNKTAIEAEDIEEAATKVKLGPAKKRLQSEEDRKITACHEAGHAIVTHNLAKMDPVHRISIVARGMSLGHTLIPPAADRTHETKSRILQQVIAMLGGRAAEEVIFNEMTSGASNDIEQATRLARAMVVNFGMSSLGPIDFGPQMDYDELGKPSWYEPAQVSPAMQERIDLEVKKIVDSCYQESISIIKKYQKTLDKVAEALLKKETLDRDDFEKITGKKSSK